jgi:hypothetical protein
MYNNGDSGDPCGVPLLNVNGRDTMLSSSIKAFLLVRNETT